MSQLAGLSVAQLHNLRRDGLIQQVERGKWDAPAVMAVLLKRGDGRGQASSERAQLDAERRRALKRENDAADGDLIPRADVTAAALECSRVVVSALKALPGRVAGELADMDDPVQITRLLKREIREARAEIAAYADAL